MGNKFGKNSDNVNESPSNDTRTIIDEEITSIELEHRRQSDITNESGDVVCLSVKRDGIRAITAAVFVVGEMAGSGVIALPKAIVDIGVAGFLLMIVCCFLAAYAGTILGKCWAILLERYEIYQSSTRDPYPAIAFEACGKPGRIAVSISNNITLFGIGIVFLLLASEMLSEMTFHAGLKMSQCYWVLILAAVLIPLTWLGSPKDMWPIAVGALCTTVTAVVIICIKLIYVSFEVLPSQHSEPNERKSGFQDAMVAFGTIAYAFGNHSILPTVQHDMNRPEKFSKVVFGAFAVVLVMYLPIAVAGYLVFGDAVKVNVLSSINEVSPGPSLYVVQSLIIIHLICGFVIIVNPVCQEIEDRLHVPHQFNWKRALIRTIIICCIVFVAESIPKFGAILSLIGGSTIATIAFIFPIVFYIRLCKKKGPWKERRIPLHQYVFFGEILLVAVITIIAATYSAILSIVSPDTFVPPCYVNLN